MKYQKALGDPATKSGELNLDEQGKKEYLADEPMLFKRPVIEYGDNLIVAWDEEEYKKIFL